MATKKEEDEVKKVADELEKAGRKAQIKSERQAQFFFELQDLALDFDMSKEEARAFARKACQLHDFPEKPKS